MYQPVDAMRLIGHPVGDLAHEAHVAAEAGNGEVHDRADPEAVQLGEPPHGRFDRLVGVPFGIRKVRLELRVADEDVLVDQGRAERRRARSARGMCERAPRVRPTAALRRSDAILRGHRRRVPPRTARSTPRAPAPAAGRGPGVRDSFGTTPGTSSGRSSRSSSTSTIISRARNCGSATMSAMLLIRLTGHLLARAAWQPPRRPSACSSTRRSPRRARWPGRPVLRWCRGPDRPQVVSPDGLGRAFWKSPVVLAAMQTERPVGAWVRVRRRRVVGDVAGSLADDPEVAVLRQDPLEHREERFGERDVHDLAAADAARSCSAMSAPMTACSDAIESPRLRPTRAGGRPAPR